MSSDKAAGPVGDGTLGTARSLPFDTSKAHQARIYNYALGGKDNYAADRAAAEAVLKVNPEMAFTARSSAAPSATSPRRRGYASSSTSAPASRRPATRTRSPRRSRRSPGWCTWTTTRSCSRTPGPC
jgi:S-adenosyl methyltransferase